MSSRYPVSRKKLEQVRKLAKQAVDDMADVGTVLAELIRDRPAGTCALCLRRSKNQVCGRADCQKEYEKIYYADRQERRRALRGAR